MQLPGGQVVLQSSVTPDMMNPGGTTAQDLNNSSMNALYSLNEANASNSGSPYAGENSGAGAINPAGLASAVDQSNLAAAPYMTQLSQLINSLNQTAQQQANMGRIPGEAGLEAQSSQDIAAELAGNLNPGTVSTIRDQMAQMYGNGGFGVDNAATSAAAMRAMGLLAEGQVQAGQNNLSQATARNPSAPIYGAQGLLVNPNEYLNASRNANTAARSGAGSGAGSGTGAARTGSGAGAGTGSGGAGGGALRYNVGTPAPNQGIQNTGNNAGSRYVSQGTTPLNSSGTGSTTYTPGGSSVFGLIDTGDGTTLDAFDSSGLYANGIMRQYGSMPDFSNPNVYAQNQISTPSMLNNFGQGSTYVPPNTRYDPITDTYVNTYGLNGYDTSVGTGWDIGSSTGRYPNNTTYNPLNDTSINTYGLGTYDTTPNFPEPTWEDIFGSEEE